MLSSILDHARRLHAEGRTQEALAALDEARRKTPGAIPIYLLMADLFEALGQTDAAEQVLQAARKIAPEDFSLCNHFANFFYRTDQALRGLTVTEAVTRNASCPPGLWLTHANLLKATGETEKARAIYEKILRAEPGNIFALASLGGLYLDRRTYKEAASFFRNALQLAPGNAHIAVQLAHTCFRSGDLEKGWAHYAARFGAGVAPRPFPQPLWQGEKLDTLLLWAEQGVGEEILYSTMIADAAAHAVHIKMECDARLAALFSRSYPHIEFIARHTPPDKKCMAATRQAPLGHLGSLFRKNVDAFPKTGAHLKADAQKTAALRTRYDALKNARGLAGKIVGISWQSKPLRHGDPKSTRLSEWESVFSGSPHLFVSLQYGDTRSDLAAAQQQGWNLHHDPAIDQAISLDDFAAQVAAMDTIITVSNTTAHMAGALAIKGAVLLPQAKGLMWHWFDGRNDSPWHPSLTLLRQERDGDWQAPLQKAAQWINP